MTVKARMLKLLEQHENELISGEAAAARTKLHTGSHLESCEIPS